MRESTGQFEPYIAVNPPEVYLSNSSEWVFTPISASELDARRGHAGRWLGTERVLFMRMHDGQGKPLGSANVICLGTRLGELVDEKGEAWMHGMPEDSVQVKILTTFNGSAITSVVIRKGQFVGLDVQAPPATKRENLD